MSTTTVGPSTFVKLTIKPMSKVLNPLVARVAGRPGVRMVAQLHHVGRRSGTHYVTSVGARVHDGSVVIPLTFGNRCDWARNVAAAGECTVRIDGTLHHGVQPIILTAAEAAPIVRATFGAFERLNFKAYSIKQFMVLRLAD
jgi:deazaflavin-dependent oxidoreductase (nitroreductase family)